MNSPAPANSPPTTPTLRRRAPPSRRSRRGLLARAENASSQGGEDGIASRLFDLLPFRERRACVDVGAWDGRHLSNTYSLLVREGDDATGSRSRWSGVLVEADRRRFEELKSLHEPLGNTCVRASVSCRPGSPSSLSAILERDARHLERDFDFLSIDVDGCDYWLLFDVLGCDRRARGSVTSGESAGDSSNRHRFYRPKVICIEFNPTMPMDLIYIQPRNDSIRHGSSLSALVELAESCDYVLVETTIFNAFFVQRTIYERYLQEEVPDTSIEALYEPSMGTTLYQLYDGTIKLWGCKRMLWHRMPMEEERMQMLSVEERHFPFAPSESDDGIDHNIEDERIRQSAIDVSAYCKRYAESDDIARISKAKRECSLKLNNTLQNDGFALVTGTGISSTLCSNALKAAKSFLHEADEAVRRSCLTEDRARRGYSPSCTENFASLIGQRGPNDLVKKFRIGPEIGEEGTESVKNKLLSLHRPNSWPSEELWDKSLYFKSVVEEYYDELRRAAGCILCAICDGIVAENASLGESVRVISDGARLGGDAAADVRHEQSKTDNHTSILTLLGYQPGSRHKKGSKGYLNPLVAAHTDVGMITVLLFDNGKCASLQRAAHAQHAAGAERSEISNIQEWVDVNLPSKNYLESNQDPILIVNVGDCLSELTGGYLRSTLHRVVPRQCDKPNASQDVNRTSIALFVGLEQSAQLVFPGGDVMTYEEWRKRWIAKALDVLKKNDVGAE